MRASLSLSSLWIGMTANAPPCFLISPTLLFPLKANLALFLLGMLVGDLLGDFLLSGTTFVTFGVAALGPFFLAVLGFVLLGGGDTTALPLTYS